MTEKLQKKLSDSAVARWFSLIIVSFTMLCGYFFSDVMSPLKPLLEDELLWISTEYGLFNSAYGWFNVVLFMLIIGGIILDKVGIRITGTGACVLMVLGSIVKYLAIGGILTSDVSLSVFGKVIFSMRGQVFYSAIGFAVFAVGVEITGITATKIIVKWFKGKEMALAMGLQVATARIGTMLAMLITVPVARYFKNIAAPLLFCMVLLCIGLVAYLVYCVMDKKLDESIEESGEKTEEFVLSDIFKILSNSGFWLIALLCLLFYSGVFPFLKYATDLMVHKYGIAPEKAGSIPAILPIATLILTPVFGGIYDKKGKGASIMILGACLLITVHLLFAMPFLNEWWFATLVMFILGVAFSLVPSAMWPSVPKIIPEQQLGTAYSLIFWIQNVGLAGVPLLIGWVLDTFCKLDNPDGPAYNYTIPMLIFACFGGLALFVALILKAENKRKGYGLEEPNIRK
ncbi:MAG: MFS transporter [Tannerellaceae bacterium]|nr:MFS transporter [Tannerellaceae bacterium]